MRLSQLVSFNTPCRRRIYFVCDVSLLFSFLKLKWRRKSASRYLPNIANLHPDLTEAFSGHTRKTGIGRRKRRNEGEINQARSKLALSPAEAEPMYGEQSSRSATTQFGAACHILLSTRYRSLHGRNAGRVASQASLEQVVGQLPHW